MFTFYPRNDAWFPHYIDYSLQRSIIQPSRQWIESSKWFCKISRSFVIILVPPASAIEDLASNCVMEHDTMIKERVLGLGLLFQERTVDLTFEEIHSIHRNDKYWSNEASFTWELFFLNKVCYFYFKLLPIALSIDCWCEPETFLLFYFDNAFGSA